MISCMSVLAITCLQLKELKGKVWKSLNRIELLNALSLLPGQVQNTFIIKSKHV